MARRRTSALATIAAFGVFSTLANSQAISQNSAQKSGPHPVALPHTYEQFVPYWTAEPGWHTDLMLRNNLSSGSLIITPVLRLTDGGEITLPDVSVGSGSVQTVDLHDALMQSHPEIMALTSPYGSVDLRYTSISNANLFASAMIHDDGHPIIFHLDGSQAGVGSGSGSHEGVWWLPKPTTKGYFVLANMSESEQTGVLWLYDQAGHASSQSVNLLAKQTFRFDLRELVSRSGLSGNVGGVSFKMGHDVNAVISSLILFDEPSGFSANMKTFVHDPSVTLESHDFAGTGKWVTRAPMLALETPDPALQLPAQTMLRPQLFLRNTANRPVEIKLGFHWRNAATDGRASLPAATLAALETRIVDVKALQDKGTIPADASWAQVTLTTNTLPDEVMAVAASFDETLRYGAQTPFSDQLAFHMEGAAWQVDQNHDSIMAIGNGGAQPVKARLTLFYANGARKYHIERTIAADDQMWVDVGSLIRNQVPDKDGNLLPSDLTTGAYQVRDLAQTPSASLYEGKVVTDKTYGHATYGCMVCCGYRAVAFDPSVISINLDGTSVLEAEGLNACSGTGLDWVNLDAYSGSWASANAAIMSVTPESARGVSIGSTTASTILNHLIFGPPTDSGPGHPCPMQNVPVSAPGNVIQVSQSPTTIGMSSGDTNDTITVSVSPASAAALEAFSYSLISNKFSSSPATISFTKPPSLTGNDIWGIAVSGTASPSGIFSAAVCASVACANQGTTITIPPQILVQMLNGEAGGQTLPGDMSQAEIGMSARNRFGDTVYFAGDSTYQNTLNAGAYYGLGTPAGQVTNGVLPALTNAIAVYLDTGDLTGGSECYWSPTTAQWAIVQQALRSGTTQLPAGTGLASCYNSVPGAGPQIVYSSLVAVNARGGSYAGAPAFVFMRPRSITGSNVPPAVIQVN